MKGIPAMIFLLLAACGSGLGSGEETGTASEPSAQIPSFHVLASGSYGSAAQETPSLPQKAELLVARTEADYERLWKTHVGTGQPPDVDFETQSVVFLLLGQRRTGGYSIQPEAVREESGGLVVQAAVKTPEKGSIVTQAITAPYLVIAVERPGLHAASWRDREGAVIATTPR